MAICCRRGGKAAPMEACWPISASTNCIYVFIRRLRPRCFVAASNSSSNSNSKRAARRNKHTLGPQCHSKPSIGSPFSLRSAANESHCIVATKLAVHSASAAHPAQRGGGGGGGGCVLADEQSTEFNGGEAGASAGRQVAAAAGPLLQGHSRHLGWMLLTAAAATATATAAQMAALAPSGTRSDGGAPAIAIAAAAAAAAAAIAIAIAVAPRKTLT